MEGKSKLIVDDTTIYEVDLDCFHCLPEEERWRKSRIFKGLTEWQPFEWFRRTEKELPADSSLSTRMKLLS